MFLLQVVHALFPSLPTCYFVCFLFLYLTKCVRTCRMLSGGSPDGALNALLYIHTYHLCVLGSSSRASNSVFGSLVSSGKALFAQPWLGARIHTRPPMGSDLPRISRCGKLALSGCPRIRDSVRRRFQHGLHLPHLSLTQLHQAECMLGLRTVLHRRL